MSGDETPGTRERAASNLLLVTVDSWRADYAGFLERTTAASPTPHLDRLAERSTIFDRALASGVPTYFSFPSIMASRNPLRWGRGVVGLTPGEKTLATVLRGRGFATAGFVAAAVYASRHFGYDRGFGTFDDFLGDQEKGQPTVSLSAGAGGNALKRLLAGPRRLIGRSQTTENLYAWTQWHLQFLARWRRERRDLARWLRCPSADVMVERAQHWLGERGSERWFLWVHLMDPHHPYFPPPEALARAGLRYRPRRMAYLNDVWMFFRQSPRRERRLRQEIERLYEASVRWVDVQLGKLFETVKQMGAWEDTVTVVTADHGEELGGGGRKGHQPWTLSPELIEVPLVLRVPGGAAQRVGSPFSLLDLAPTLLDFLGVDSPPAFAGTSRSQALAAGSSWSEPAITEAIHGCTNPWRADQRLRARILAASNHTHRLTVDFDSRAFTLCEVDGEHGRRATASPARQVERELIEAARADLFGERHDHDRDTALRAIADEIARRGMR